ARSWHWTWAWQVFPTWPPSTANWYAFESSPCDDRGMRNQLYLILLVMGAEPDVVLRPLNETVLKPGPVSIVAKTTGELLLDGKAIPSTQPAPGVRTATVTPSAGL